MNKKPRHRFGSLTCLPIILFIASQPLTVQARDLEDASRDELHRMCESAWKLAKSSATKADSGVEEDTALSDLDEAISETDLGPNAAHMMRTIVKGAYVRPSGESPSKYAAFSQNTCMQLVGKMFDQ